jgi:hypothetical protein
MEWNGWMDLLQRLSIDHLTMLIKKYIEKHYAPAMRGCTTFLNHGNSSDLSGEQLTHPHLNNNF